MRPLGELNDLGGCGKFRRADDTTEANSLSQGLHASTLCLDLDFPWGGADTDPAGRAATVEAKVAA